MANGLHNDTGHAAPANQQPNTTQFPSQTKVQVNFGGGCNPMVPSHLLQDDEVQTATNIDFSLINGALTPRRGSYLSTNIGTSSISTIFRNYNGASITSGFLYAVNAGGDVYRGTGALGTALSSIVNIGTVIALGEPGFSAYKQYTVFSCQTNHYKDDGTNVTEWIKQVPAKPVVTVNTLTPITLTGTYSSGVGTLAGTTSDTATQVSDANGNATVNFVFSSATSLAVNGTNTIGNFGAHLISIAFSNPTLVKKVTWDYSIGNANFDQFWHVELDPASGGVEVGQGNAETLVGAQLSVGTNTSSSVTNQQRQDILSQIAQYNFSPLSFVPTVASDLSPWAVTVPQFSFVGGAAGTAGTDLWSSIYALRISVVSEILSGTTTYTNTITCGHPQVYGAEAYPLTDVQNGYYYWQTYATLDTSGNKIDEGASSPPAGPFPMQNAQAIVVNTATATGSRHGVNAIVTYRQGGYMGDAYAIYTYTGTGTTSSVIALATITDTMNDIDALSLNNVMPRGLMAPSQFPGDVANISAPFADRLFISDGNVLRWSLPGQLGSFPLNSFQEVSRIGDNIMGLVTWSPGLIIVNNNSVYELTGGDFEAGQYALVRSGARRGSLAPKTVIQTPFGIPLLNADGLTMYVPGYSMEQEIPWFMAKYGDIFKGSDPTDPASWKGNRVPALNLGSIEESIAGFKGHKLYLGLPCGPTVADQKPNTLFIIDFNLKQCYWFTYPFSFSSILVDDRQNIIYVGTTDGAIMQIETSIGDQTTSGVSVPTVWYARTRSWTSKTDTVLENLSVDGQGALISIKALYDGVDYPALGNIINPNRTWFTPPLNGTFVNSAEFDFIGTYSSTNTATASLNSIYQLSFDLLEEPTRVQFWRTEYDEHQWTADKLWDVSYHDIDIPGTCTVTAVTFVDNTAVMTNTMTGPSGGRVVYQFAFPPEIYGRIAYTTYTTY